MDYPATHLTGTPGRSQVAVMRPVRAHFLQIDIRCARPGKGSRVPWRARSLIHANLIETLPNLKCIVAVGCCRLSAATRQSTVYFDAIVTVDSPGAYIVVCRDLCTIIKILLSNNNNVTIGSPEQFGDGSSATRVQPRSGSRPQGCQGPGCEEGGGNGM